MNTKGLLKRGMAAATAVLAAFTILSGANNALVPTDKAAATGLTQKEKELNAQAEENASAIDEKKAELEELEQRQAELDEQIESTEGDLSAEEENQAAISEQIETVETTLATLEESIVALTNQIEELEQNIADKEAAIEVKKDEIEVGISEFKQRIRAMYIAGNESYSDILVGATDFYDMLMKLELVRRVADHDNEMIDDLVKKKDQLEIDEAALQAEKEELEADKADLLEQQNKHEAQRDKLDKLYSKSQAMINQLEADKEAFIAAQEQRKAEQEAFEEDLQKLFEEQEEIKAAQDAERKRKEEEERKRKEEEERKRKEEEERRKKEEAERQAALLREKQQQQQVTPPTTPSTGNSGSGSSNSSSGNKNNTSTDNSDYGYTDKSKFTWPCPGFYHISYGVGWRWGSYHQGIDIYSANIRGANICAAADGTVIRVVNGCPHDYGKTWSCGCGGGYGNYCIIDHGGGYWTLYGHSEGITVTVGQQVKQGDVLGTVGSTGHSTGPHLHFEVRLNGVAQNPQNYV